MKSKFSSFDLSQMRQAIRLAKLAQNTSPNPPVGAVLVKQGKVISVGYHQGPGKPHAEIEALKKAKGKAKGATLYVTLEPCCHLDKRTPPCVNEIIKNKISKVVVGILDPNPQVNGKGIRLLKENKISVQIGCLQKESEGLIKIYKKWIRTRLPYLILKAAVSLDGKIATETGDSHWITGKSSRVKVHQLRSTVDAVLIGSQTLLKDNPSLTVRWVKGKNPIRIILDSHLRSSPHQNVFRNVFRFPTWIATLSSQKKNRSIPQFRKKGVDFIFCRSSRKGEIDLQDLLIQLGKKGISSVLIEGGGALYSSFLKEESIDEFWLFMAPLIIGGKGVDLLSRFSVKTVKKAPRLQLVHWEPVEKDFLFILTPSRQQNPHFKKH